MLSQVVAAQLPWVNADFAERAGAEFLDLLSVSLEASASISRELSLSLKRQGQSRLPPCDQKLLATNWKIMRAEAESDSNQYARSLKPLYKTDFAHDTAIGSLNFKLRGGTSSDSSNVTALGFMFIPSWGVCDNGFAATLMEIIDGTKNPRIARSITPFSIIGSPIAHALQREDIKEVQDLVSSGKASLYDRSPEGHSLLSVSQRNEVFGYL